MESIIEIVIVHFSLRWFLQTLDKTSCWNSYCNHFIASVVAISSSNKLLALQTLLIELESVIETSYSIFFNCTLFTDLDLENYQWVQLLSPLLSTFH